MRSPTILDRQDVLSVLFHPRRALQPSGDTASTRTVRIPVAADVALAARLHITGPRAPLILLLHGNGEIAADYDPLAPVYVRIGLSLLVVDYRGYGGSDGKPTSSTLLGDAVAVFDELPELMARHALSPSHVFVMGRSLGSAPAIEIAAQPDRAIAGLIIESGFAHTFPLIERLGGPTLVGREADDGFANLAKIAQVNMPTLIIHGESDRIIPVADGQALHARCGAEHKRLLTIPHAGHNDLLAVDPQAYFQAIRSFVATESEAGPPREAGEEIP